MNGFLSSGVKQHLPISPWDPKEIPEDTLTAEQRSYLKSVAEAACDVESRWNDLIAAYKQTANDLLLCTSQGKALRYTMYAKAADMCLQFLITKPLARVLDQVTVDSREQKQVAESVRVRVQTALNEVKHVAQDLLQVPREELNSLTVFESVLERHLPPILCAATREGCNIDVITSFLLKCLTDVVNGPDPAALQELDKVIQASKGGAPPTNVDPDDKISKEQWLYQMTEPLTDTIEGLEGWLQGSGLDELPQISLYLHSAKPPLV